MLSEILIAQITCALNGDAKNILEKFSRAVALKQGQVLSESSSKHDRVFTVVIQVPKPVDAKEVLGWCSKEATVNLIDVGAVEATPHRQSESFSMPRNVQGPGRGSALIK